MHKDQSPIHQTRHNLSRISLRIKFTKSNRNYQSIQAKTWREEQILRIISWGRELQENWIEFIVFLSNLQLASMWRYWVSKEYTLPYDYLQCEGDDDDDESPHKRNTSLMLTQTTKGAKLTEQTKMSIFRWFLLFCSLWTWKMACAQIRFICLVS